MCVCVCVCVCMCESARGARVRAHLRTYALRIISMDKTLHFTNSFNYHYNPMRFTKSFDYHYNPMRFTESFYYNYNPMRFTKSFNYHYNPMRKKDFSQGEIQTMVRMQSCGRFSLLRTSAGQTVLVIQPCKRPRGCSLQVCQLCFPIHSAPFPFGHVSGMVNHTCACD